MDITNQTIYPFATSSAILTEDTLTTAIIAMRKHSQFFVVTPLPDGMYRMDYKTERFKSMVLL